VEEIVLDLQVQPRAKKTGFAGRHGTRTKIRLAAPPADGKANEALIEFLAAHYGVPKRNVVIEAGEHSRQKRVRVWKKKS
jgi:uncharacterized protein (TIGR00251 family)